MKSHKKIIMIFNLKNKTGKSDVECVKDVFGKMYAVQSLDDIVDERMRECEEYRSIFRDGSVEGRERGKEGKSNEAERRENTEREAT